MDGVQNDLRNYQQLKMSELFNKKIRQRLKSIGSDTDRANGHYISEKQLSELAESLGL